MKKLISIIMLLIYSLFVFSSQTDTINMIVKSNGTNKVTVSTNPAAKIVTFDYATATHLLDMSTLTYITDTILVANSNEIISLIKSSVNKSPPDELITSIQLRNQIYFYCQFTSAILLILLCIVISMFYDSLHYILFFKIVGLLIIGILFFALLVPPILNYALNADYSLNLIQWSG